VRQRSGHQQRVAAVAQRRTHGIDHADGVGELALGPFGLAVCTRQHAPHPRGPRLLDALRLQEGEQLFGLSAAPQRHQHHGARHQRVHVLGCNRQGLVERGQRAVQVAACVLDGGQLEPGKAVSGRQFGGLEGRQARLLDFTRAQQDRRLGQIGGGGLRVEAARIGEMLGRLGQAAAHGQGRAPQRQGLRPGNGLRLLGGHQLQHLARLAQLQIDRTQQGRHLGATDSELESFFERSLGGLVFPHRGQHLAEQQVRGEHLVVRLQRVLQVDCGGGVICLAERFQCLVVGAAGRHRVGACGPGQRAQRQAQGAKSRADRAAGRSGQQGRHGASGHGVKGRGAGLDPVRDAWGFAGFRGSNANASALISRVACLVQAEQGVPSPRDADRDMPRDGPPPGGVNPRPLELNGRCPAPESPLWTGRADPDVGVLKVSRTATIDAPPRPC
jgi:hypothetical protein